MARRFVATKTEKLALDPVPLGESASMKLIYGDEVDTTGPVAGGVVPVTFRGRSGSIKAASLDDKPKLEVYVLDVGQGDSTLIVTPGRKRILIDGGDSAAAGRVGEAELALTWLYRLDESPAPLVLDLVVLTHADSDHLGGLISLIRHPKIEVRKVIHSGIATYTGAEDQQLGQVKPVDGTRYLLTRHHALVDLDRTGLSADFTAWVTVLEMEGVDYQSVRAGQRVTIDDPAIDIEVLGPVVEHLTNPDRDALRWFGDKAHTINGHSVVLRLTYDQVRFLLSGDLNIEGSRHLMADPARVARLDAHVLKAPHHGSHEYDRRFLEAVNPQITTISSGEIPDHGHPRANFLGTVGGCSRSDEPLLYSTALSAVFGQADIKEVQAAVDTAVEARGVTTNAALAASRQLFHKLLHGVINIRTDGKAIHTATRVQTGYWWVTFGPLTPAPRSLPPP